MAITGEGVANASSLGSSVRARDDTRFYILMSLSLLLTSVIGFAPAFATGERFGLPIPRAVLLHGAAMLGWVVIAALQPALIQMRRRAWHRRLGWVGAAWAVAVVIAGLQVTLNMPNRARELAGLLNVPLAELSSAVIAVIWLNLLSLGAFVFLVTLGVRRAHDRATHQRCLLAATILFMGAPLARILPWFAMGSQSMVFNVTNFLVFAWFAALAWHDVRSRGQVHRATLIGTLLHLNSVVVGTLLLPQWEAATHLFMA